MPFTQDLERRRVGPELDRHLRDVAHHIDAGASCPVLRCPRDRSAACHRAITTPVLVIGFADDLVLPPHLGVEVADALPNGRYVEIPDTGHLGFLERPQAVSSAILNFFARGTRG